MIRKCLIILFFLGLIYVTLPGPSAIDNFPALPNSKKSDLSGDTVQNPNIAAFYSDFQRNDITKFYKNAFQKLQLVGLVLPSFMLNHPPELAYIYIRDQQESTFLEEYYYPLRESFFTNGYEPTIENIIFKRNAGYAGNHIVVKNKGMVREVLYDSKTTIRYYPTNPLARIMVYLGIWIFAFYLYKLFKKAWKE